MNLKKEFFIFYTLFHNQDKKTINRILELIFDQLQITDLFKEGKALDQWKKTEPNNQKIKNLYLSLIGKYKDEQVILNENIITSTQIKEPIKLFLSKKMLDTLLQLQQKQDITYLLIINNAFTRDNNNNQLQQVVPFKITLETFEMYASVLNAITKPKHYCTLFKEDFGSIGNDLDLLPFLKKRKHGNLKIIINPPFTEILFQRAIDQIIKIIKTVSYKKITVYMTTPQWSDDDYTKGGLFYPLIENGFTYKKVDNYQYYDCWNDKKVPGIKSTIFLFSSK